jgi:microsomal dipeptidase-like Zn-dependent dipeptidase
MTTTLEATEQDVARAALDLQARMNELKGELGSKKEELRKLANGTKKEIVVEGIGKVNISAPFEGSEKPILVFDEERLNKIPELRQKLIDKGVAKEDVKKVPATAAKVTIKPNV